MWNKNGRKNSRKIRRGDIYYADLSPTIGSEQDGIRPVLVLQNDVGNRHSHTVIVAAITGQTDKNYMPTHVHIGTWVCGLNKNSLVLLEHIRTIDNLRLNDYIGSLPPKFMDKIDKALKISVGLDYTYNDTRPCAYTKNRVSGH